MQIPLYIGQKPSFRLRRCPCSGVGEGEPTGRHSWEVWLTPACKSSSNMQMTSQAYSPFPRGLPRLCLGVEKPLTFGCVLAPFCCEHLHVPGKRGFVVKAVGVRLIKDIGSAESWRRAGCLCHCSPGLYCSPLQSSSCQEMGHSHFTHLGTISTVLPIAVFAE